MAKEDRGLTEFPGNGRREGWRNGEREEERRKGRVREIEEKLRQAVCHRAEEETRETEGADSLPGALVRCWSWTSFSVPSAVPRFRSSKLST